MDKRHLALTLSLTFANMWDMKTPQLLLLCLLLLFTGCTRYSAYLADFGSRCDGVIVKDSTIYRAGSKMYIKGQRTEFRKQTIPIWSPKGPNSRIVTIDGAEGESVYHEIIKAPRDSPDSHTLSKHTTWTIHPPTLSGTDKQHTLNNIRYTETCHTDLNALWAYPAAVVAFAVVDVPCNIGVCCFAVVSIPVLFIKEQLAGR